MPIIEGMTKKQIAESRISDMLERRGIEEPDLLAKAIYNFAGRSIAEAFGKDVSQIPPQEGEDGEDSENPSGATGSGGNTGDTGGMGV